MFTIILWWCFTVASSGFLKAHTFLFLQYSNGGYSFIHYDFVCFPLCFMQSILSWLYLSVPLVFWIHHHSSHFLIFLPDLRMFYCSISRLNSSYKNNIHLRCYSDRPLAVFDCRSAWNIRFMCSVLNLSIYNRLDLLEIFVLFWLHLSNVSNPYYDRSFST